jgi:acetolactate synthase-1/2/3 large subunit
MSKIRMNVSDLFVKALENEGVEIIYGIPGEENLDFLEAMRKSGIKLLLTRHEHKVQHLWLQPMAGG